MDAICIEDICPCAYWGVTSSSLDSEGFAKIAMLRFEKNSEILAKYRKTEIIMRKFDLAAAKAGAPVCTRGGCAARIICFDLKSDHSVIARVPSAPDEEDIVEYWPDGRWYPACAESRLDLMMRDDDYAEKLARGEYGNHIHEAIEKVDPTIKENSTTDRECWRRVYAGQVMPILVDVVVREGKHVVKVGMGIVDAVVEDSLKYADALIEELEKQRNDE